MATVAAWGLLVAYLALAVPRFRKGAARLADRLGDGAVVLLVVPYVLATNVHPPLIGLLKWGLFLLVPTLLMRVRAKSAKPLDLFQVLTLLAIWAPRLPSRTCS